jgi:hypothetical protein
MRECRLLLIVLMCLTIFAVIVMIAGCCPSCAFGLFYAHTPQGICANDPFFVERIRERGDPDDPEP